MPYLTSDYVIPYPELCSLSACLVGLGSFCLLLSLCLLTLAFVILTAL